MYTHLVSVLARFCRAVGLPLVAVGVALLLALPFRHTGFDGISPLCFGAVMFSAWYGGLISGLVATALAGIATAFFLMEPAYSLAVDADDLLRLMLFCVVAVLTSSLHEATRRAAKEAVRAKEAAEGAQAAQSQFLAMVSHELRTPLNPVLMGATILERDKRIPEDLRWVPQSIRRNVAIEIRLIDDLLDLVRVRHGKLSLAKEAVDVARLVADVAELCREEIEAKNIRLEVHVDENSGSAWGDPIRLRQVLWNLVRNAAKFTPEGGCIRISARAGAKGFVAVKVSDTGIGIEPNRLAAIFHAFEQGDIGSQYGGLGLGLAICRAIVSAHDGTISARSQGSGKGAKFTVELPVARETQATVAISSAQTPHSIPDAPRT